jgi:putative inorganic carbon (HCO3(-)) transporter
MRLALLAIIVGILAIVALVRPRVGVYGYIWFAVMRPDVLAFAEDQYPFSLILAAATVIGSIRYLPDFRLLFATRIARWLLVLQIPLFLSYIFAVRQDLSEPNYVSFVKMMAVPFLIPVLIREEEHLRRLLLVIACSISFVGARYGLWALVHGGVVLIGGYGEGMLSDNNLLALGLTMGVPLCWYSRQMTDNFILKWIMLAMACLSAAAVVMTNSRGGSVALGVVVLLIVFRSKRRMAGVLVAALFLGAVIYLIRDEYLARMATLEHATDEASAASRLTHAGVAFRIWKDHPILGVGFGGLNYLVLAERYSNGEVQGHVAHNSYLQMLVDSGFFAFLIYGGLLAGTVIWLGRKSGGSRNIRLIRLALQTSIIAFMIGGTFYSCQRYDLPYILLLCAASLAGMSSESGVEDETTPSETQMELV